MENYLQNWWTIRYDAMTQFTADILMRFQNDFDSGELVGDEWHYFLNNTEKDFIGTLVADNLRKTFSENYYIQCSVFVCENKSLVYPHLVSDDALIVTVVTPDQAYQYMNNYYQIRSAFNGTQLVLYGSPTDLFKEELDAIRNGRYGEDYVHI